MIQWLPEGWRWAGVARYEGELFRAEGFDSEADALAWLEACRADVRFVSGMVGEYRNGRFVAVEQASRMQRGRKGHRHEGA